jgi:hypothetical protein
VAKTVRLVEIRAVSLAKEAGPRRIYDTFLMNHYFMLLDFRSRPK